MKTDWKAWDMLKSCQSKVRFRHEGQAKRRAHELGLRPYKCKYCPGWHLTRSGSRGSK